MSSEEILQIVNAVTPAAIAIIGVVTSCLKVISSFKSFKNTTAQDIDELREDIKVLTGRTDSQEEKLQDHETRISILEEKQKKEN